MTDAVRITFKKNQPNPLFHKWIEELYRETTDRKVLEILEEAMRSLSKYPLPLQSGAECAILKGFGKKLCMFLDKKLEIHKSTIDTKTDELPEVLPCINNKSNHANTYIGNKRKKQNEPIELSKKNKKYKPAFRSGGYAILIALLNHCETNPLKVSLTKDELIEKAQSLCEESFTRPKPESFYTAWSTMSQLIKKGLVLKTKSKKVEYQLTDNGMILGTELLKEYEFRPTTNDIINQNSFNLNQELVAKQVVTENENRKSIERLTDFECEIELPAQSFDVILLIDKQETGGTSKKNDPTVAQFNKYPDLKHEYKHLKVGDFTWIARCRTNKHLELVLPYIVERKRMDDFGASIKDGRFHEQKFRLKKCGVPNVIYLIENYGSNKHVGLPVQSLMQAIANTRVQDGFKVHITDSLTNTARFLAMMTKRLTVEYEDKHLKGKNGEGSSNLMTFSYFNKSSSKTKTLTVKETFIKILLQLKGVSVEKALAITSQYKTPRSLIEAYSTHSAKEGEMLLANLRYGDIGKNVGPSISKSIYQLFTINDLQ